MAYNSAHARGPRRDRDHRPHPRRGVHLGHRGQQPARAGRAGRQREVGAGAERLPAPRRPHPEPGRDGEGLRGPGAHRPRGSDQGPGERDPDQGHAGAGQ
jgi:hypothetical protein